MCFDGDGWVKAEKFAQDHVDEMAAFECCPRHIQAELRCTGQSALDYLRQKRERQHVEKWDLW